MSVNINMEWDKDGEHFYETGVDQGVLYPQNSDGTYADGVNWNGLTSVDESPSGADSEKIYADNGVYLNLQSAEEFGGTIGAYTYPDEFKACNGETEIIKGVTIGQQSRKGFGFSYRTKKGNETNPDLGYLIHLWYGCKASPSEKSFTTVNDSPEAIEFSWEVSTTPRTVSSTIGSATGLQKTSQLTIDTTELTSAQLDALYAELYGERKFTEFQGDTFVSGVTYYERSGTSPDYVYTPTTDTAPQQGKTYYIVDPATSTKGKLPTPERVYAIISGAV